MLFNGSYWVTYMHIELLLVWWGQDYDASPFYEDIANTWENAVLSQRSFEVTIAAQRLDHVFFFFFFFLQACLIFWSGFFYCTLVHFSLFWWTHFCSIWGIWKEVRRHLTCAVRRIIREILFSCSEQYQLQLSPTWLIGPPWWTQLQYEYFLSFGKKKKSE
jgi:hypothetical protein